MKNTDYNNNVISTVLPSEDTLSALLGMIYDLDLEIVGISPA